MRRLAESRLAAEIVTRWALPKRDAAKIVRYVLNEVVDDLRQCRLDTPDPDLRIGMYGGVYYVHPGSAHSEKGILRLIELGRASFRRTNGNAVLRQLSRNESLVLLVDELGFEGAGKLIARFVHVCGGGDAAANGLHIPKVAAFAVTIGSFPTTDVEQMRGSDTVH